MIALKQEIILVRECRKSSQSTTKSGSEKCSHFRCHINAFAYTAVNRSNNQAAKNVYKQSAKRKHRELPDVNA